MKLVTTVACLLTLFSSAAMAVDGVVLIDQNKALAGAVTPGDAPGFPITISQPGSYRLSSNLVLPAGATAISIAVNNVTIDLNGFSIIGTPGNNGTVGISYSGAPPATGLTIRNGIIDGAFRPLSLGYTYSGNSIRPENGAEVALQNLLLRHGMPQSVTDFVVGAHSIVNNVSATGFQLLVTGCPVVVSSSVFNSLSYQFASPSSRCVTSGVATDF